MPAITADNRNSWQALANNLASDRPSVGKRVRVARGRKYRGTEGVVCWHGPNRYYDARYESQAEAIYREIAGTFGYRVQIDTGQQRFFIAAEYVEVLSTES